MQPLSLRVEEADRREPPKPRVVAPVIPGGGPCRAEAGLDHIVSSRPAWVSM